MHRSWRAAPGPASSSMSGPVTSGPRPAPAVLVQHGRSGHGHVSIHFRTIGRGTEWFTRLRPGDRIDMLGPLGRPFEVDPRSRHLLLIAGGLGIAGVRMLADEALRDGRQVVLLFGAASRARGLPVDPAAGRDRVRGRDRRRLAGPSRLRDRPRARVRGLGRPGVRVRAVPDARGARPAGRRRRDRLGVATLGRKRGAGASTRTGRRRRAGRHSSRFRWSRTWAARSGRAWAAW